jgi:hypothetical protein
MNKVDRGLNCNYLFNEPKMLVNSAAVMQPYLFPNLAYYKLVRHVEHFVFYDDVHFIKGGWINKNNILYNAKALSFRLPLVDASSNKLISDVVLFNKDREIALLLKKLTYSYAKAPFFNDVIKLIEEVLTTPTQSIAELAEQSILLVFNYLKLPLIASTSSTLLYNRAGQNSTDRLIELIHSLDKKKYLNAIGGKALYNKEYFKSKGIDLFFISATKQEYKQFNHPFVPGLSMIDVLMFNHPEQVLSLLDAIEYE